MPWPAVRCRQSSTISWSKITKLLTPIIPHTAEEIWSYLECEAEDFVQLADLPEAEIFPDQDAILEQWEEFMALRTKAQKALEEARNEKIIGKSLEAHLTIYVSEPVSALLTSLDSDLAQLLIVSQLTITEEAAPAHALVLDGVAFVVEHASGQVCERCRRIDETVKDRPYHAFVCDHCADILEANFAAAVAEGFESNAK